MFNILHSYTCRLVYVLLAYVKLNDNIAVNVFGLVFSLILEATTLLGQIQNRLIDHLDFILHHLFLLICAYYIIMLSTIYYE